MEVRRHVLLEGTEEAVVFHYLDYARKEKRLTLKMEKTLLARSRSGERQATETLVDANRILVVALSETYDDDRLGLMDRIAEGNVALISACRNYLPLLDGSFRRYCQLRIRKAIEHALAEVASFRVVVWEGETHHPVDSIGHDGSGNR
ncbi:MAG: hypothetical protein ABIK96_05880 [bacterium]